MELLLQLEKLNFRNALEAFPSKVRQKFARCDGGIQCNEEIFRFAKNGFSYYNAKFNGNILQDIKCLHITQFKLFSE